MKQPDGKKKSDGAFFSIQVRGGLIVATVASIMVFTVAFPVFMHYSLIDDGWLVDRNNAFLYPLFFGIATFAFMLTAFELADSSHRLYHTDTIAIFVLLVALPLCSVYLFGFQFTSIGLALAIPLLFIFSQRISLVFSLPWSWLVAALFLIAAPLLCLIGGVRLFNNGIFRWYSEVHVYISTFMEYLAWRALTLMVLLAVAAWRFPVHRRVIEYFRPRRLPRLRAHRSGVTLIELLIVILIMAIFVAGIAHMTSVAQRAMERRRNWELALDLVENEFVLLRELEQLPEPGEYPVEEELATLYDFADQAKVEIRPGPHEAVREVRVTVQLRANADERDVTLVRLLPAKAGEGGRP